MLNRDSEQEQSHVRPTADLKFVVIKTRALLVGATAVQSSQWAYVSFLKLDLQTLK